MDLYSLVAMNDFGYHVDKRASLGSLVLVFPFNLEISNSDNRLCGCAISNSDNAFVDVDVDVAVAAGLVDRALTVFNKNSSDVVCNGCVDRPILDRGLNIGLVGSPDAIRRFSSARICCVR